MNVDDLVRLELYGSKKIEDGIMGYVDILDVRYGSLWTSITYDDFKECGFNIGDNILVEIFYQDKKVFSQRINYGKSFADVEVNEPLIYMNSVYDMALAINKGDFSKAYNIGVGKKWTITMRK